MRAIIRSTLTRLLFLAIVAVLAPVAALAGYGAVRLVMDVTGREASSGSGPGAHSANPGLAAASGSAPEFESAPERIARRARDAWSGFAGAVSGSADAVPSDVVAGQPAEDPSTEADADPASESPAPRTNDPLPASTLDVLSLTMPEPTRSAPTPAAEARKPDPRNAAFDDWVARARVFEAPPQHLVRYGWTWEDHSSRIVRFDGDRAVIDRNRAPTKYEIEVPIDVALAEELEAHFGFPRHALAFWYRSPEELLERLDAQQAALEACGMRFVPADGSTGELNMPRTAAGARERGGAEGSDRKTGSIGPDYQYLLDHSRDALRPLAQEILRKAKAAGARDLRSQLAALASFVQHLDYVIPPKLADGKERAGLRTPMATLIWGGDCDSKSLLLAGLVRSVDLCDATLVHVDDVPDGAPRPAGARAEDAVGHMIAGFNVPARPEDFTIDQGRQRFVLVETTSDWRIGRISAKVARSVISRTDILR
jgi:hypothetical protein